MSASSASYEFVTHEIEPVFDRFSRVLILGTMPSPKSREQHFYYGHPQNRFWKMLASLFDEPIPETIEEKRDLCLRRNIALWDVVANCEIKGASDASIRKAVPNDLAIILEHTPIEAIFTTGTKAGRLYRDLCEPMTGIPCAVLPSTSPANSRVHLDELCATYKQALSPYLDFNPTYPVLDVDEVVRLEQAIAANGTSLYTLMHRAGRFLAYRIEKILAQRDQIRTQIENVKTAKDNDRKDRIPHIGPNAHPTIAIMCGNGNNGGDGWVAAHLLAQAGYRIDLITSVPARKITAEPAHETACEVDEALKNNRSTRILVDPSAKELKDSLARADVIIDAILGTGFSGDTVREPFADWINAANALIEQRSPTDDALRPVIIAADVASGFSARTGNAALPCIKADLTVTMIALKTGLVRPHAHIYCGDLIVAPLAPIRDLISVG